MTEARRGIGNGLLCAKKGVMLLRMVGVFGPYTSFQTNCISTIET
jgi:hypothetical protein